MKGFMAYVYRTPAFGDCTNKGPSSRLARCMIVDPRVPDLFTIDPDQEFAVEIRTKNVFGKEYIYAAPLGETRHVMMGGNFIHCSDSRFSKAFGDRPIPLHDRIE